MSDRKRDRTPGKPRLPRSSRTSAGTGARSDDSTGQKATVVAVGASAGGLNALKTLLSHVPPDSGLTFVIVVHLSPEHESHLADLLQPHTMMPVMQVTETTPLVPGRVYVIPPNRNMSTIDTHLRLSDLEVARAERAPIDHFFRTLSDTHDGHAVGVLLSGTGSDGTQGLRCIKSKGGLTVVQTPDEAEYRGMPQTAIASGMVDLVLPVADMVGRILEFVRTRPEVPVEVEIEDEDQANLRLLHKILVQLKEGTGHDFTRYKPSTVTRRLSRRMQIRGVVTLEEYLGLLRSNGEEKRALVDDLLITVTSFFRDTETYQILEEELVPRLFEGRHSHDQIRVWSVGCATGEEAYSLAMLLLEQCEQRDTYPRLQIFASDLHERSVRHARDGVYPETIEADVSPARLARFFVKADASYRVRREVRELVVFAHHNLLSDPPFSSLDLITCRNVMIYLQRDVQQELIALFHYALAADGLLMLGSAETMDRSELFRVENKRHCLYQKRNVETADLRLPVFPLVPNALALAVRDDGVGTPPPPAAGYNTLHLKMVELYAPPSVLLNDDHTVVHFSDRAGRYFMQPGGLPTNNVFKLVRPELRIDLRAALHAAKERRVGSRSKAIPVQFDGEMHPVVLHVRPSGEGSGGLFLVIFDEIRGGVVEQDVGESEPSLREYEVELDMTKQRLQSIIEDYETSQEDLRASNEELQSTNEELRSTLEELETSKEELQSINEELQTVNQENRQKVEELSQLSSDLQNLLHATDLAILFLDRDLRIMRFTQRIGDLFNMRDFDKGRPLADLTHHLGYGELHQDAKQVLERLSMVEREVADQNGRWYLVRLIPYRSVEDRIEGVVITFVEITALKRTTDTLRVIEERYRLLMENVQEYAIIILDPDGVISTWNMGAQRAFGYTEAEAVGRSGAILFTDDERRNGAPQQEMDTARREGRTSDERWHVRKDGTRFWGTGVTTALYQESDGKGTVPSGAPILRGYAKVMRDNTHRKESEDQLRRLNETLEERVRMRTDQVSYLASTLTMAEQAERRRIAEVLHNDLQQRLYSIQMKMTFVRKEAEAAQHEALRQYAGDAYEWLNGAIETTRQLTVDLSPPVLEGEGLAEALQWLQSQMGELHGLRVELEAGTPFDVPDEDMRVLLFQTVRELLFNVVKHADTDRATVTLAEDTDSEGWPRLTIRVTDRGRGFDVRAIEERHGQDGGFGLFSVRERLRLFGGTMRIVSAKGEGTDIALELPAPPKR